VLLSRQKHQNRASGSKNLKTMPSTKVLVLWFSDLKSPNQNSLRSAPPIGLRPVGLAKGY